MSPRWGLELFGGVAFYKHVAPLALGKLAGIGHLLFVIAILVSIGGRFPALWSHGHAMTNEKRSMLNTQ